MPVVVEREQLEPCRVELAVEVPPEQVQQAVERVFQQMAKRAQVPGFRPGKAPRRLLERVIDQDRVNELALERVVSEGYREALAQTGLTPYDEPELKLGEVEEGKPVSFRVTIPLPPRVELGEIKGLTFTRLETAITDADVEAELGRLREGAARFEEIEEPAQEGDRVLATVQVSVDGEPVPEASETTPSWLQVGANLPDFDAGLQGVTGGEERTFNFTYPEDFVVEERRGKQAEVRLHAVRVQRRVLPGADDAFAASVGYDNLEALRSNLRDQIKGRAASLADTELDSDILRAIVSRATVHFPEEMVTREVADDVASFVKSLEARRVSLNQYLESREMDLQKLEADYADQARPRIANTLVLMEIARQNQITVEASDVEAEIERRAAAAGTDAKVVRRILEEQDGVDSLENRVFFRKVLDFLKSVNTIEEKAG
jgi:trigger factor